MRLGVWEIQTTFFSMHDWIIRPRSNHFFVIRR